MLTMLRNVCEETIVALSKNRIISGHSKVTSKIVSWYHFSRATLYEEETYCAFNSLLAVTDKPNVRITAPSKRL